MLGRKKKTNNKPGLLSSKECDQNHFLQLPLESHNSVSQNNDSNCPSIFDRSVWQIVISFKLGWVIKHLENIKTFDHKSEVP